MSRRHMDVFFENRKKIKRDHFFTNKTQKVSPWNQLLFYSPKYEQSF